MVLVGTRKDSESYVRNKKKACEDVGIKSFGRELPEDVSEEEVLKVSMHADTSATRLFPSSPLVGAIAACAGHHCMSADIAICPRLLHSQQQHRLALPALINIAACAASAGVEDTASHDSSLNRLNLSQPAACHHWQSPSLPVVLHL